MLLNPLLPTYDTLYNTLPLECFSYEPDSTGKRSVSSHISQNNVILWLSLVLNWIIKIDNFCSANFPEKPKETMNRLHDENWRRSQGGRKSSVFYRPQASSGFYLLCVSWLQGEEWMIESNRLTFPITLWMLCDSMLDTDSCILEYETMSWTDFPSQLFTNDANLTFC